MSVGERVSHQNVGANVNGMKEGTNEGAKLGVGVGDGVVGAKVGARVGAADGAPVGAPVYGTPTPSRRDGTSSPWSSEASAAPHSLTVRSAEPVASCVPSGLNTTLCTRSECCGIPDALSRRTTEPSGRCCHGAGFPQILTCPRKEKKTLLVWLQVGEDKDWEVAGLRKRGPQKGQGPAANHARLLNRRACVAIGGADRELCC